MMLNFIDVFLLLFLFLFVFFNVFYFTGFVGLCGRKSITSLPVKYCRSAPARRCGGRKKPACAVDMVITLFTESSKSYREVWKEFNRLYAADGMKVCLGTVYNWVQKYCSEADIVRVQTRNQFPDFAPANVRWQLDGTGKVDEIGVQHFILGIVDYGTRLNLLLQRLEIANSAEILQCVLRCVDEFGKPKIIRTDNASVFKSVEFQAGLKAAHIRHEFTNPGCPRQNGRIERLFLTLKEKLNLIIPIDADGLDCLLAQFRFWYNSVRPHQHLHNYTPMEVWTGVNPFKEKPQQIFRFSAWEGMLRGFYMRR